MTRSWAKAWRAAAWLLGLAVGCGAAQAGLLDGWRDRGGGELVNAGESGAAAAAASLPAGAREEHDLAYGSDPQQKLDLYLPPHAEKAPVILMVHGGAWMIGDKANRGVTAAKAAYWLPRGYILASVNYRMDRNAPNALQQADDVARALAFVQHQAASWGGDPARVVLMGHSSGAHLVSLITADPQIALRQGAQPTLGTVALDSAVFDLPEIMDRRHYRFYDHVFGTDRQTWIESSPYQRLSGTPRPMLLVCSSRRDDSCPQAQRFAAKAVAAGGRATVLPVDLRHGDINTTLGQPSAYTSQVEDFLKSLGLP